MIEKIKSIEYLFSQQKQAKAITFLIVVYLIVKEFFNIPVITLIFPNISNEVVDSLILLKTTSITISYHLFLTVIFFRIVIKISASILFTFSDKRGTVVLIRVLRRLTSNLITIAGLFTIIFWATSCMLIHIHSFEEDNILIAVILISLYYGFLLFVQYYDEEYSFVDELHAKATHINAKQIDLQEEIDK